MDKENTNIKHKKAVAISYQMGDLAPKIVASGQGHLAQKILSGGAEHDIPVYKDSKLVEELSRVDIGENIPPELYEVVASVLVFISDLDRMEEMRQYHERQ